jgi:hypothetical protein
MIPDAFRLREQAPCSRCYRAGQVRSSKHPFPRASSQAFRKSKAASLLSDVFSIEAAAIVVGRSIGWIRGNGRTQIADRFARKVQIVIGFRAFAVHVRTFLDIMNTGVLDIREKGQQIKQAAQDIVSLRCPGNRFDPERVYAEHQAGTDGDYVRALRCGKAPGVGGELSSWRRCRCSRSRRPRSRKAATPLTTVPSLTSAGR